MKVVLAYILGLAAFSVPGCSAFTLQKGATKSSRVVGSSIRLLPNGHDASPEMSRQDMLRGLMGVAGAVTALVSSPSVSFADVSDGTSLPPGIAEFSRILRLQRDIKKVAKRVSEGGSEIDKQEWDNIGKFLRTAYNTGDDMKALTGSIKSPENKKRALDDIEQLKKYAQAGDVSVNKQDPPGFIAVADKMSALVSDYLESLRDVPDEI